MTTITAKMTKAAYAAAKDVCEGRATLDAALDKPCRQYGMNEGSAKDYIVGFKRMRDGERYTRTFNAEATEYFLGNILKDYGVDGLRLAVDSARLHIEYYEKRARTNMKTTRRIVDKYAKIADQERPGKFLFGDFTLHIDYLKTRLGNAYFNVPANPTDDYEALCDWISEELGIDRYYQPKETKHVWKPIDEKHLRILDALSANYPGGSSVPVSPVPVYPDKVDPSRQYAEGAVRQVTFNQYERNPAARAACVSYYAQKDGSICCAVCDLDFSAMYGEIGRGFIHIHHLEPLAKRGEQYQLNPIKDLCPVCPNCHAMLHKQPGTPYTVEELKEIIDKARRQ